MITNHEFWILQSASGIWIILFACLSLEAIKEEEVLPQRRLFLCNVRTRYFPLALYGVFAVLNQDLLLGYITALAVGYGLAALRHAFAILDRTFFLTATKVKEWEDSVLAQWKNRPGWVPGHSAMGDAAWSNAQSPAAGAGAVSPLAFGL